MTKISKVLDSIDQNNSLQIPPLPKILDIFKGGGSVQNPDPSGACGGLFKKMNFTFPITVTCIDFFKSYTLEGIMEGKIHFLKKPAAGAART